MHSIKELIKLSKRGDFWYSWGDVYLQGCLGFTYGFAKAQKSFPVHIKLYVFSINNNHGYEAVSLDDASRVANYYFDCWRKKKVIAEIEKSWKREDLKLSNILSQLSSIKLKDLKNEELYDYYDKIQKINENFWENISLTEAVAAFEENLLPELIEKKFGISQKDFLKLGAGFSAGETIVEKYQRSLESLKKSRNLKNFSKLVRNHIKKFYWIKSGFHGYEELTANLILKEVGDEKPRKSFPETFEKKNSIIPREVKDWFEFLSQMALWKDEKKRIGTQANYWMFKICEEIATKKNIDHKIVFNTTPAELKALVFKSKKFPLRFKKEILVLLLKMEKSLLMKEMITV